VAVRIGATSGDPNPGRDRVPEPGQDQFTLAAGQSLPPGSGRVLAAQMSGSGTTHPTSVDTHTVTYTTGGTACTQSGHLMEIA
jgi:hypothetical protein